MASRYLKLDPEFGYIINKEIKSSREVLNNLTLKINAYKQLRGKEIVLKNKLKVSFSNLKTKINFMESTFPEEERKSLKNKREEKLIIREENPYDDFSNIKKPSLQTRKKEDRRDVSDDLEEIRQKLESLK
jgi:hypothetical protein